MTASLALPILRQLVPDGFAYGSNLLVEFDPKSIWYETSLTIAADALKAGVRSDYHTFQHYPDDVLRGLTKLGLDVGGLQSDGTLSIIDSYTVQLGVGTPKIPKDRVHYQTQSVKLSVWSIYASREMKAGAPEPEKGRLHIDDNTSVLLQYNDERAVIDFWRTRAIPIARVRNLAFLHSIVIGVYSDAFYRQWESIVDGIVELRSEERSSGIEHSIRVRSLRGKNYDSRWHKLKLLENGEVILVE